MPGGTSIGWNENAPADSDAVGSGDDEIRSLKTSLRQALASEHAWPSAGGLSGYHTYGSARAYVGVQSLVSSDGTDGRMMLASDSSHFFLLQSTGTVFGGGARALSAGSFPGTTPQRHHWVVEFGTAVTPTSGSGLTTVTFPNSGFSGKPFVTASIEFDQQAQSSAAILNIASVGAASFSASARAYDNTVINGATFNWISVGTRVL